MATEIFTFCFIATLIVLSASYGIVTIIESTRTLKLKGQFYIITGLKGLTGPFHRPVKPAGLEEGDLRAKLGMKAETVARSIIPARSESRNPRSAQMEQLLSRYQNPFTLEIDGLELVEKFKTAKFTMYLGEIRIVKQMNEVLSVHLVAKKPRQSSSEPGSITFTEANFV
ncbi:hypothetical protein Acr_00g0037250 [Actinidia rufa]|uniref:Uncharacterized protein n=1 Tax=Actinidia rufa TaxID=165716 RepID=A0A7J0DIQ3_9ERIC|nr:hypothetical protein Acr_00g0037250 [Actinidia rufa]